MIRTYKYKLYNNPKYQQKFDRWIGVCRLVYNSAKALKEHVYQTTGKSLSKNEISAQLPNCKSGKLSFIKEVSHHTLQSVLERLDRSYKNFFEGRAKYPKWAAKGKYKSFVIKQGHPNRKTPTLRQTQKGFNLPKFGEVKVFNNSRRIEGKIKRALLKRKADGIHLHVVVEQEDTKRQTSESQTGLDLGISCYAKLSDCDCIENPKHLDKYQKQMRIEQRSLSRKNKGSNRWEKQRKVVAKLHKKIADTRRDFLHKESTKLANKYDTIIIEDLNIPKMIEGNRLSRDILDSAWGKFREYLEYKTNNVIRVNQENTSRECSECGFTHKDNRKTQSEFKCLSCGHEENADCNAAKVIEGRAFPDSR